MSDSLGQMLRAAREAKGLTLEEVEKTTRIRARFLAALEAEAFDEIPSPVQVRGFLRNYAQHVGLNAEQMLAFYEQLPGRAVLAGGLPAPRPVYRPRIPQVQSRRPRWLSADVLVAAVITLALAALLLWGGLQWAARLRPAGAGPALAQATVPASATLTPEAGDAPTSAPLPSPLPAYVGVNVTVRAEQRAWMKVTVDGTEIFSGLMKPGEARDFAGQSLVEVLTGNGKGTRVIWNGRDQGTLGEVGEVVARAWTITGMVIPTPTVTPTPTATETPTPTAPPTASERPSATAPPSVTPKP